MNGYKLLLVPEDRIMKLSGECPQQATVEAESSVCNCDNFWAGPFEVAGEVGEDRRLRMSRALYETIEVIG